MPAGCAPRVLRTNEIEFPCRTNWLADAAGEKPLIAAAAEHQHHDTLFIADAVPNTHPRFSPEGRDLIDNRLGLDQRLRAGV